MGLLLTVTGDLVTVSMDKAEALGAFFALVFTSSVF